MSGLFSYDFLYGSARVERQNRIAVLFSSRDRLTVDVLSDYLNRYLERNAPPDHICIVAPATEPARILFSTLVKSDKFLDRLPGILRSKTPIPLKTLLIDVNGAYTEEPKTDDGLAIDDKFVATLKQSGFRSIFRKHGGILPASPSFHYVKPSGKHCDRFIRSAEILTDGGEVDFIACGLLPFISEETDYVFCDTASISVLAYSLAKMQKSLRPQSASPVVETFRSYSGLDACEFGRANEPLCLISASTSGDMVRCLLEKGLTHNQIVTLFYLGDPVDGAQVLHNLTRSEGAESEDYEKIELYSPEHCPHCKRGSLQMGMSRDYLIPESLRAEPLLLRGADAPSWLRSFLSRYLGSGIIKAHYGRGFRNFTHEIFFDVGSGLSDKGPRTSFHSTLVKVLTQCLPASTIRIIHLDDNGSESVAQVAQTLWADWNADLRPEIVSSKAVTESPDTFIEDRGTTVIFAGCIVGGRSLMELGQILRSTQRNGCIVFVAGICRFETLASFEEVRSNITYSDRRSTDFDFHYVEQVFLPNNTWIRDSIWDQEVAFLRRLLLRFDEKEFPRNAFEKRIALLEGASDPGQCGLEQNLFWGTVQSRELKLRPNFAFFFDLDYDAAKITQAEVFVTMAAVLHNLRLRPPTKRSLQQFDYKRTLISPKTFYRLDDGIIQAAVLRSALAREIDYSLDEELSAEMYEVVSSIILQHERERGEATIEFLLALAIGQLRLASDDTRRVMDRFLELLKPYPVAFYLCRCISENQ